MPSSGPESESLTRWLNKAKDQRKQYKRFLERLKKQKPAAIDQRFHSEHEAVFEVVDCLECANCCKTTSPIFRPIDIERLSAHLKMKPAAFTEQYLHLDEDGDYVHNGPPCPFLGDDNYCSVYNARPQACREYPHTDRKNMHQILELTLKNTRVCPAVSRIVSKIIERS